MTRYVLAVDPGKVTGLALFSFTSGNEPTLEWSGEVEFADFIFETRKVFYQYKDNLEIICEKFTINAQTAKKAQAPYSLEVIGALKCIMLDNERDPESLMYQQPADAMAMFTNEKLKKLEYWHRGGAGHALDAIRHGLLRLVKSGWVPTRLLK
jgi:hypothetical protein